MTLLLKNKLPDVLKKSRKKIDSTKSGWSIKFLIIQWNSIKSMSYKNE